MFNNLVNHYLDKLTDMDRAVGQGAQLNIDDHQCVDLYAHELKNLYGYRVNSARDKI